MANAMCHQAVILRVSRSIDIDCACERHLLISNELLAICHVYMHLPCSHPAGFGSEMQQHFHDSNYLLNKTRYRCLFFSSFWLRVGRIGLRQRRTLHLLWHNWRSLKTNMHSIRFLHLNLLEYSVLCHQFYAVISWRHWKFCADSMTLLGLVQAISISYAAKLIAHNILK